MLRHLYSALLVSRTALATLVVVGAHGCAGHEQDEGGFDNPEGFTAAQTRLVAFGPGQLARQGKVVQSVTAPMRLADRQRRGLAADAADPQQDLTLEVTFHGDYTQGMRVATAGHPRAYVDVLPVGAQKAPGRLRKDGAVLAFEGAYPNVTSAFGASSTKVEEILVVQRPEEVPSLRYVMRSGAEPVRWDPTERGGLQAFTEQGRALYALVPPMVIDAQGKRVDGRWEVLESLPGQVTIEARLGLEGLTYPLAIDPTFENAQWTVGVDGSATARGAAAATYNSGTSRQCVVVFGGLDSAGLRNDLLLNCASSWSLPTATGAPTARAYAAMAQDRSNTIGDLYVFGGYTGVGGVSNELYKLTYTTTAPRTATWTKLSPTSSTGTLPKARMMHGFAWTKLPSGSNGLMMWGGVDYYGNPLTDMWSYSPTTNQWTQIACSTSGGSPACPPELYGPTIVQGTTTDPTVYQLGGYSYGSGGLVNTVSSWNGTTWSTRTINDAFLPTDEYDQVSSSGELNPAARYVAFGVRNPLGGVLYGGGVIDDGSVKSDLWTWLGPTTSENRWHRLSVRQSNSSDNFMLGPRESPVAVFDESSGQVVFFGGTSSGDLGGSVAKTTIYKSSTDATVSLSVQRVNGVYVLRGTVVGTPNGHEEVYFLQRVNGVWQEIPGNGSSDCYSSADPKKLQQNKPCLVVANGQEAFAIRARDDRYVIGGTGSGSSCKLPVGGAQLACSPSTSFQATAACLKNDSEQTTCTIP